MSAEAAVIWVVAVWLADGRPAQYAAPEPVCREMAAKFSAGDPLTVVVDGKQIAAQWMACWRAEDGRLKEKIQ